MQLAASLLFYLSGPFTMSDLWNQEIGRIYVVEERHATDFEASMLWKGRSGSLFVNNECLLKSEKNIGESSFIQFDHPVL